MSDVSLNDGQQLDQAVATLTATTQLIDSALSALKKQTSESGRVVPARLDEHQLACYELSVS